MVKGYSEDQLILKVNFDKIDSGEIQFTHFVGEILVKIENKNKEQMIENYKSNYGDGGIMDFIMSLEYFT